MYAQQVWYHLQADKNWFLGKGLKKILNIITVCGPPKGHSTQTNIEYISLIFEVLSVCYNENRTCSVYNMYGLYVYVHIIIMKIKTLD